MKVLIVDDSKTMLRILKNVLQRLDIEDIEEAENGVEAFDKFKQATFDLVITDWNMPEMDGLALVKEIRKISEVPIVMVTTEGGKKEVITALKAGVNNYIVKPFTPQVLKDKLQAIFG